MAIMLMIIRYFASWKTLEKPTFFDSSTKISYSHDLPSTKSLAFIKVLIQSTYKILNVNKPINLTSLMT